MSNAARDPTPPADPTVSDDLGPADARGTGAPGDALPEYSERIARTIDDAARLLDDASVFHDAASLLEAAREQLDTWQAQLTEPTNLRAVERDVADQLAILTLRESARAASWQAETRDAQADAIQRQRDRRASREDSRRRAAEVSRRLEELPPESERDAYRRFLEAVRDSYLSMANDDELERVLTRSTWSACV